MAKHPYESLPNSAYWRRSFQGVPMSEVDPVLRGELKLDAGTRVATAGSCFAQHLARHLRENRLNFYVTEKSHPVYGRSLAQAAHFGDFPARFGNIYTARQLLQLFKRVYGTFEPREDIWRESDGTFLDPFRPQIQPGGFSTEREYWGDRDWHFKCVREMFEGLDVFIFTLGLTETWRASDGAVFPLCPGVAGGRYDPAVHSFYNQPFEHVVEDLSEFLVLLRKINERAKVILTVSPVPLAATKENRHVLVSTVYSKAVLRAAAQRIVDSFPGVHYFPSFEIITGTYNRGAYFGGDFREVHPKGVQHVMRLFMEHYTSAGQGRASDTANGDGEREAVSQRFEQDMVKYANILCDEERLDPVER
jgi:hypothetical protein